MSAPLVLLSVSLLASGLDDPYLTEVQTINPDPSWIDPTAQEFAEQASKYQPFRASRLLGCTEAPEMAILLEVGLGSQIGMGLLQQWVDDIEAGPYTAQVIEVSYGTPEEMKGFLDSLYDQGLEGAVLVGNLPTAWVAVWDTEAELGEHLPCDYFFMDLDGDWLDLWVGYPRDSIQGPDGYYDTFQGTVDPEIWIGRMRVDNLSALGDPVQMLQGYLDRNHQWRTTGDPWPVKALCYVDDDWQWSGEVYRSAMELLYEQVDLFTRPVETAEHDYEQVRLPDTYAWVSPFVHSSPNNHFWQPAGGTTNWSEIVPIGPPARFYNLFACSNCRFTTDNNMGGVYVFATDAGLAAVGSTCSGAMLWFTYFYGPLGGWATIGEAYRLWWDHIALYGLSQGELNWHIGMVLLGDPSLVPASFTTGIEGGGGEAGGLSVSPNPGSGCSIASFELGTGSFVTLAVYDVSGRMVTCPVRGSCGPGLHEVQLDGLGPGVYFVLLEAGGTRTSERFVMLD